MSDLEEANAHASSVRYLCGLTMPMSVPKVLIAVGTWSESADFDLGAEQNKW